MLTAAPNLLVSNHSYGSYAGWQKTFGGDWQYWGNLADTADYKFGIYDEKTQMYDSIAYNAPYYLIVKSAGNNRNSNGPPVGSPYQISNDGGMNWIDITSRPAGISFNNSYDVIPTYGVAKNILTVGAVEGIASGSTKSSDIKMSSFSSWGPTDDGRIKPDLVADGVDVLSCSNSSTTGYEVMSGTSMATPNVTGSLYLLQELL
jgi:subtilisin family serine protease